MTGRDISHDPVVNRFVCRTKIRSYDVSIPSVCFIDRVTVFAYRSIGGRSTCRQTDKLEVCDKKKNSGRRHLKRIFPTIRGLRFQPGGYSRKHFQKYIGHQADRWSG